MQHLHQALQQRLKHHKLYQQGVGFAARDFFRSRALNPNALQVTIRGSVCHVKLSSTEDRQGRYLKKQQLLEELTATLRTQGWEIAILELKIS